MIVRGDTTLYELCIKCSLKGEPFWSIIRYIDFGHFNMIYGYKLGSPIRYHSYKNYIGSPIRYDTYEDNVIWSVNIRNNCAQGLEHSRTMAPANQGWQITCLFLSLRYSDFESNLQIKPFSLNLTYACARHFGSKKRYCLQSSLTLC